MKIQELVLKNFGKFTEKTIKLEDGINILYGENESGKTTLYTFIKGMLFGMERGRGRASINDTFSRYEPWENPNYYAGSLRFECGGRHFCIERHFDKYAKKTSLICEDDGEELSVEHGDLDVLLDGMGESGFDNTVAIGQLKVETNQSLATELKNYATNYYATGNSEIDLEGAFTVLKERKKEIDKSVKVNIGKKQEDRARIEQETSYVWRDLHKLEQELENLRADIKKKAEREEAKRKEALEKAKQEDTEKKYRVHPLLIAGMVLILIPIVMILPRPWSYLCAIVVALAEGLYVWNRMKEGKRAEQVEEVPIAEIVSEHGGASLEKLKWQRERLQEELKEKQVQYSNLQEQLEELDEVSEDDKKQDEIRMALELAASRLQELSGDIQKQLSRDLNEKASEILCAITGGKYTRVLIDKDLRMHLHTKERKIPMEQVSRGTIEQIYFALRMASTEVLYEEDYPVILDDTFVFYDDKRLEGVLKWLVMHKKQVLLFTCQNREAETLNRLGLKFALHCDIS